VVAAAVLVKVLRLMAQMVVLAAAVLIREPLAQVTRQALRRRKETMEPLEHCKGMERLAVAAVQLPLAAHLHLLIQAAMVALAPLRLFLAVALLMLAVAAVEVLQLAARAALVVVEMAVVVMLLDQTAVPIPAAVAEAVVTILLAVATRMVAQAALAS